MSIKLHRVERQLKERIERQMREEDGTACQCQQTSAPPVDDEIQELHKPIIRWLQERNWPYQYSDPSKRTRSTVGWPDFSIVCPNGKLLFVECKSKNGTLTKEQSAIRARAAELGHYIWVVYSMEEFAEAVSKTVL